MARLSFIGDDFVAAGGRATPSLFQRSGDRLTVTVSAVSREGDLLPMGKGKSLRAQLSVRGSSRELSMTFKRTVTMLALAREALERFDNNADAAQAYLSERLVNDEQLREALVRAAIEYERLDLTDAPS